jgi:hypothetical protein
MVWAEDAEPAGATLAGDTDGWNWVTSNPTPYSGSRAHQSAILAGTHQHFFQGAKQTLAVEAGDRLFAYVYLDPANVPEEVMLQWNDGTWDHRAYWGANKIEWGTNGTASRRYVGPLPAAGQWVRLEVPAGQVGLESRAVNGMAFSLYGRRATWDRAGKTSFVPNAPHVEALAKAEAAYRQAAYQTLLNKLGTSYEELRLARAAEKEARQALAERLGLDLAPTHPDQLDNLFLEPDKVAESSLEKLFGLAGTTGGSSGDGSECDLLAWQLAHLRTLWKQQDHAQKPDSAPPIIDPDVIGQDDLKDPIAGNFAYDRWLERRNLIAKWLKDVKDLREKQAKPIDGFNAIVNAWVCPVQDLIDLAQRRKSGENIEAELAKKQLSLQAFIYLMRLRDLAVAGTVLPGEWDEAYSILVQVKKLREYKSWREVEKQNDLALEPAYFKIPLVDPSTFPPPPVQLPAWRATRQARRDWQKALQARIDQREGVAQDLRTDVDST